MKESTQGSVTLERCGGWRIQSSAPDESSQKSAGQSPEHRSCGTFISFKVVGRFV